MKVNCIDDEITIYLNNNYISKVNFLNVDSLEEYMNALFLKLKNIYSIKLNGFYNIDIYIDDNYGAIIHILREEIDYYDYFDDQIDTQIKLHNNADFLYKINDLLDIKKYLKNNYSLYKYNNELYLKLNEKINKNDFINILEYCNEICYDIDKIIKTSNLLI